MAGSTPIYGIPYPQASDLVAAYPALGEDLAEKVDEKLPRYQSAAPSTPSVGQVWIDSDDNLGRVWTGSVWQLFSGAGNANFTNAATGTYTDTGINYKYLTVNSTTNVIFDRAGFVDLLIVGGGGGGHSPFNVNGGGSGAGGHFYVTSFYVAAATYAATIGAGGTGSATGNTTRFGTVAYIQGGAPGSSSNPALSGSSGAGAERTYNGGTGVPGLGNNGGNSAGNTSGGGGGGAGAAGANSASGTVGGAGGNGTSNSITGTAVTRAGGGGGSGSSSGGTGGTGGGGNGGSGANSTGTNGTANTGGGAGANGGTGGTTNGGSGLIIVRVRTN